MSTLVFWVTDAKFASVNSLTLMRAPILSPLVEIPILDS